MLEQAAILRGAKIEDQLQLRPHRNAPMLVRTVLRLTLGLLFPKIGGSQPPLKLKSLLSQERVKLYGLQIRPVAG